MVYLLFWEMIYSIFFIKKLTFLNDVYSLKKKLMQQVPAKVILLVSRSHTLSKWRTKNFITTVFIKLTASTTTNNKDPNLKSWCILNHTSESHNFLIDLHTFFCLKKGVQEKLEVLWVGNLISYFTVRIHKIAGLGSSYYIKVCAIKNYP